MIAWSFFGFSGEKNREANCLSKAGFRLDIGKWQVEEVIDGESSQYNFHMSFMEGVPTHV